MISRTTRSSNGGNEYTYHAIYIDRHYRDPQRPESEQCLSPLPSDDALHWWYSPDDKSNASPLQLDKYSDI